jgi:hypothetical protein
MNFLATKVEANSDTFGKMIFGPSSIFDFEIKYTMHFFLFYYNETRKENIFVYKSVNFVFVEVLTSSRKSTRCFPNETIELFFSS